MTTLVARPPLPRPGTVRLVRKTSGRSPRVPFGLASFHDDGEAVVVALEMPSGWSASDLGDLGTVVAQIPAPSALASGTLVIVLGDADRAAGLLPRLFGAGRVAVPRALRSSALLARGYHDLGAGVDAASGLDLAWGYARY